jgi:hypothetical protein
MRIATLLVIDRQPAAAGAWGEQTLSLPGVVLPTAIPGTVGLGVFVEVEVDPQDTRAQQLDVWVYVRPLDTALQVIDELSELLHLIDRRVAPIGTIAEPVNQSFVAWVPRYPVEHPRQLWFEARLNNVPEAERSISLVPRV